MSGNPDDERLEELREKKMEELRERQGGEGDAAEAQQEAQERAEAQQEAVLKQHLTALSRWRAPSVRCCFNTASCWASARSWASCWASASSPPC